MSYDETFVMLREILTTNFNIPPEKVTPQAQFRGTFGMDSLDIVDFIFFLREKFGVTDELESYAQLNTVDKVCNFIVANAKTQ